MSALPAAPTGAPTPVTPHLITPDDIETPCIQVLQTFHKQHLAALERDHSLPPQTIEPLRTIDLLAGEGIRLREDTPPACLLGVFGTTKTPERRARDRTLTFTWHLAVLVVAVGTGRRDTLKRRGWYAMTVAECLLSRLPRDNELVDSIELTDIDFTNGRTDEQSARIVGEAQLTFAVQTLCALDTAFLPPADTTVPPGTPFGPPETDYAPPAPDPVMADGFPHTSTDRDAF